MGGVTWDQRSETDWLASNGRWYPRSKFPTGWVMSSLPPAPEHAEVGSILRRVTSGFSELEQALRQDDGSSNAADSQNYVYSETDDKPGERASSPTRRPARPQRTHPPQAAQTRPGAPASARDRTFLPKEANRPGGSASATVTRQSTYKPKVGSGPPPPSALPPPPGRIRDADDGDPASPSPSAPAVPTPPQPAATDFEVVAGDLGKVFGVAKRRIERAINESAAAERNR